MNNLYDSKLRDKEIDLSELLKELKKNPIFKMSLGSKELFHSNFLEYINEVNEGLFLSIINRLLPDNSKLPNGIDYKLSRELENFDLCLYHEEVTSTKKKKDGQENEIKQIIFDLILENKVKSIPRKEQLKEYEDKVVKHNPEGYTTRYILLSLAENFADKSDIENENVWQIKSYKDLYDAISSEISSSNLQFSCPKDKTYIQDYCDFISNLHRLQEKILMDVENQPLFQDVEEFKKYRLHDLYIKLRCAKFLILLQKKLEVESISPVHFLNNHGDIRKIHKTRGVYLNQNIFRSVGQAAAFLYRNNGEDNDIYEIVVQGNQYRHGINSCNLAEYMKEKVESQNKLWKTFNNKPFEKKFLSLSNVLLDKDLQPPQKRKNNKSKIQKIDNFCGYNHDYVYKYKDISILSVKDLLEVMAKDIIAVFKANN